MTRPSAGLPPHTFASRTSGLPALIQASLLEKGFSLDSDFSVGLAVSWCATFGHADVLSQILEASRNDLLLWQQLRLAAAILAASRSGQDECAEIILSHCGASFEHSPAAFHALIGSVAHGHRRCAQILLPWTSASDDNWRALVLAARHGHSGILEDLMAVADMSRCGRLSMSSAIEHGQEACVLLLIPHVDLASNSFEILASAIDRGHVGILFAIVSAIPNFRAIDFFEPWIALARRNGCGGSAELLLSFKERVVLSAVAARSPATGSPQRI